MRSPTRPGDDDLGAGQRSAHRELDAGLEPRRVGVDADEAPVVGPDDVVDGADRRRVGLHLVDQVRDDALVRRRHAETEPVRSARVAHGGLDRLGLELEEDVAGVDPRRVERRVVHDRRMAPLQRLPDQADPAGHCQGVGGRRTGPAVTGNVTLGMISSTHSWSWSGSGVIVCRKKYSTPASTRAWSEATISSGVPKR